MIKRVVLLFWLLALAGAAQAHMLPKQTATMNIIDEVAYLVVSVPVSALKDVDTDESGALSVLEIEAGYRAIQLQFEARFHVSSDGVRGEKVLTWVVPPQTDGEPADTDYLVIMHRVNFASLPETPAIETDLFGTKAGETQMTMTATRQVDDAKVREVAILQAGAASHTFFRGGWAIFADFVRIGVKHIWGGFDHLLFLLTIIVAAAGWRYWLAVVTSFTLAHSITLTLSALNIIRIPASIIEPGIAASIVVMAVLNLRYRTIADSRARWVPVAIVFGCGLLHGFGFAGAIGAMAVDTGSRIATLAGFNVGIEIGQFLFVGAAMLIITLLRRAGKVRIANRLPRYTSIAAAAFGAALLVQRSAYG